MVRNSLLACGTSAACVLLFACGLDHEADVRARVDAAAPDVARDGTATDAQGGNKERAGRLVTREAGTRAESPQADPRTPPSQDAPGAGAVDAGSARVRFAVIGDYGYNRSDQGAQVAALVHALAPDFIATTGDNNYPLGEASTIDFNIGMHYADYIAPYLGSFGSARPLAGRNRFFPSPGNHDWGTGNLDAYLQYFTLPGNERYYDVVWGSVHLFVLDSDPAEPDGIDARSPQALWLRDALRASAAPFKVVLLHHPPYSSGSHGDVQTLAWPFAQWGASLVLAGHDHDYERLALSRSVPLVVNGIGGAPLRPMRVEVHERSQLASDAAHGTVLLEADAEAMEVRALSTSGGVLDHFMLKAGVGDRELARMELLVPRGSYFRSTQHRPEPTWTEAWFDDRGWTQARAPAGFGQGDEATQIFPEGSTVWFRHEFELSRAPASAWLSLVCQDGCLVHLNGQELHRVNMPATTSTPEAPALQLVKGAWQTRAVDTLVDERLLVPGKNVIAVEVHRAALSAGQLRMDLELRAR